MIKNPRFFLKHIIEASRRVKRYVKGVDEEDFIENELIRDAVVRNIEIIGD